jgi:hypothetical protein
MGIQGWAFEEDDMSPEVLYRACAVAAVITGVCIVTGSLLHNVAKPPAGAAFNFTALLVGIPAMAGLYLRQREEAGAFGLVAFVLVYVGLALMMCMDYFGTFVFPTLPAEEVTKLQQGSPMVAMMVSGIVFLLGEILFGISVIRSGVFSRIAAVLFMIGFLPTTMRQAYPWVTFAGSVMSGGGIIWWGLQLWGL